ncbi:hypothetical protein ACNRWW_06765 [Metabacillus sp. HB246100]
MNFYQRYDDNEGMTLYVVLVLIHALTYGKSQWVAKKKEDLYKRIIARSRIL